MQSVVDRNVVMRRMTVYVPSMLREYKIQPLNSLQGPERRRKERTHAGATCPPSRTKQCSEIQLDT